MTMMNDIIRSSKMETSKSLLIRQICNAKSESDGLFLGSAKGNHSWAKRHQKRRLA